MPSPKPRRRKPGSASSQPIQGDGTTTTPPKTVQHYEPASVLPTWDVVIGLLFLLVTTGGWFWYQSNLKAASAPPWTARNLPGRGVGLVATRDILQGERLIRERPFITVPPEINTSPVKLVFEAVANLSPPERNAFYSLSHVHLSADLPPDEHAARLPLAIFQTNAVSAGAKVGLFPRMARLNHGCSSAFNTVYSWREKEGVLVVYAIKPIKAGEELLTAYTDTKRPRSERRAYLHQHYGFNCTCAACSLPPEELAQSDARLAAMAAAYVRFASWSAGEADPADVVSEANRIWGLGEMEGYWSERGRLAADAAWVSAAHSDEEATREWARRAVRWYGYELGTDSEEVQEMVEVADIPRSHPSWGSRSPMRVGGPDSVN